MSLALAPALLAALAATPGASRGALAACPLHRPASGGMAMPPPVHESGSGPQGQGRAPAQQSTPAQSGSVVEASAELDALLEAPPAKRPLVVLEPDYLLERDVELSGFLRAISGRYENTGELPNEVLSGMSLANARLAVDARAERLRIYLSLESAGQDGLGWLSKDGEAGELEVLDAYGELGLGRGVSLQVGQFRPPTLFTTLLEDNELLFIDRTFNSLFWQERQGGAQIHLDGGPLQGWVALQDGADGDGREMAFTGRCSLRLFGEGEATRREGAYDADLGSTLYLGASWYDDQSAVDASAVSAEAYFTHEWLALSGELVDPGDGLQGGHLFWSATGAVALVPETWELAARYEDFRSRSDTFVYRVGLNRYLQGPKTKLQANVVRFEHDGSNNYMTLLELGLVASF